jgi:hypothetical protein
VIHRLTPASRWRLLARRKGTAATTLAVGRACRVLVLPLPSDGVARIRVLLQEVRNRNRQLQLDCARMRAVSAQLNQECGRLRSALALDQGRDGSVTQRAVSATCSRVSLSVYEGSA